MISPDEFLRRWGTGQLVSYDPHVVNSLDIPEVSRQFLIQAGLPRLNRAILSFNLEFETLIPLPDAAAFIVPSSVTFSRHSFPNIPEGYRRYRLLGINSFRLVAFGELLCDTWFCCLDEQDNGKVVSILNEPGYKVELLNNTVPQLAEMLLLQEEDQRFRRQYSNIPKTEGNYLKRQVHSDNIQRQMLAVDPEALNDGGGWTELIYNINM